MVTTHQEECMTQIPIIIMVYLLFFHSFPRQLSLTDEVSSKMAAPLEVRSVKPHEYRWGILTETMKVQRAQAPPLLVEHRGNLFPQKYVRN